MSYDIMPGKPREECGVFGIYSQKRTDVAFLIYLGLHSLQHRGQESAGMVVVNQDKLSSEKGMGLVDTVFNEKKIAALPGQAGIGHVRYSTNGSSYINNCQPILINCAKGSVALAHNGNLVNSLELRLSLESQGSIFYSTLDTEVIAHLIARSSQPYLEHALLDSLDLLKGAFSLVVQTKDKLIGVRDPHGFRPLVLGELDGDYILASETCALDIIGAKYIRDVKAGEMLVISEQGLRSYQFGVAEKSAFCIFEYIYLARPDSIFNGNNVHMVRREMGKQLAREANNLKKLDLVVPVPDSGISSAQGFAQEAKIPFEYGLIKNRYVGRTFINPTQEMRNLKVRMKLNPLNKVIEGKSLALIDDSIVRGTTSKQIVDMLKEAKAREVHLFISSPPVTDPCYYGLDTANRKELLAANMEVEKIRELVGADSLNYLSQEGLLSVLACKESACCSACFTGEYPTELANCQLEFENNGGGDLK